MSTATAIKIVNDSAGTWPWKACDANPGAWCATSAEDADYCLEVLPPIYFRGGFAVSEPIRHTAEDVPVYLCLVQAGGVTFARQCTVKEAAADVEALRAAVLQ